MSYVLAKQRDADVVSAFREYRAYLSENASSFPPSAYELAMSDWYFDFSDHRCPHDAWLQSATLHEPSTGSRREIRSSTLTVHLLGAYHDGYIEFVYPEVRAYELSAPFAVQGHGDWRYDEFRVAEGGGVIHEIEWAAFGHTGRWLIEAAELELRGDYQDKIVASGADVVFALTGDFVYLTNDMGLFVDGYFIKQDVRWTEADLAALTKHLRERDIKIVLHEWEPSEAIQNAVRAAEAKLVVLDGGDPGVVVERALAKDGLQQILRKNLEAIVAAAGE